MSDPNVGGWLRSVTPGTSERFRHYLEKFCDFSRLSPSELLTLAQSDKVKTIIQPICPVQVAGMKGI